MSDPHSEVSSVSGPATTDGEPERGGVTPRTHTTQGRPRPETTLELAELLSHTARRLRRGSSVQLAPLGLTYAQARVLRLVAAGREPLRMADLAAQLDVVPRSVTTMVDALETAGLVARHADPGDRRSVLVALSEAGRLLLVRLEVARRDSAEEVFGGLDVTQRHRLLQLLEVLCVRGSCVSCCGPTGHGGRTGHGGPTGHGGHGGHGAGDGPAEARTPEGGDR
jgi:DNA-binding MarR family transcriptional regulator